eukprot:TRINITY_DN1351_c0_g1_i1.p1 TRINITY_DN1351_c0_g1~~TRINITY_DN1351_c0_g1_i1.p1  ORF type:complete len:2383 (+),score=464.29 TRINITY_DN1351_c0_g1_i1:622-7149(+)
MDSEDGGSSYSTEVATHVPLAHPSPVKAVSYLITGCDDAITFMTLAGQRVRFWSSTQQTAAGTFSFYMSHSILVDGSCTSALWLPPIPPATPPVDLPPPPFGMVKNNNQKPEHRLIILSNTTLLVYSVTVGAVPRRGMCSKLVSKINFKSTDGPVDKLLYCSNSRKAEKDVVSMVTLQKTPSGVVVRHFLSNGFSETTSPVHHYTLGGHCGKPVLEKKNPTVPILATTDGNNIIFWHSDPSPGHYSDKQLPWLCAVDLEDQITNLSWVSGVTEHTDNTSSPTYSINLYVGVGCKVIPICINIDIDPLLSFLHPITKQTPPPRNIDPHPSNSFHLPSIPAAFTIKTLPQLSLPTISIPLEPKSEEPEEEPSGKSAASSKYAHLLGGTNNEDKGEGESGKANMANKYAHLLGGAKKESEDQTSEETPGKSAMASKYAHLLGGAGGAKDEPEEQEAATGKSAMASKYAHLLGGAAKDEPEKQEAPTGKSAMASKYAHLLGGSKDEPEEQEASTTGKSAMASKYAHLLGAKNEEQPAEEASGKSAMANKYAHLLGGDTKAESEPEAATEPTTGKSAMASKYAHLLGGAKEDAGELTSSTDGKSAMADKYSHLLGGRNNDEPPEQATAVPKETPLQTKAVEINSIIDMKTIKAFGSNIIYVISDNGFILWWVMSKEGSTQSCASKLYDDDKPITVLSSTIIPLRSTLVVVFSTSEGLFASMTEFDAQNGTVSCVPITVQGPPEDHKYRITELEVVDNNAMTVLARVDDPQSTHHRYDLEVVLTDDGHHKLSYKGPFDTNSVNKEEPFGELPYHPETLSYWLQSSDLSWEASRSLRGLLQSLKNKSTHYKDQLFGSNLVGSSMVAAAGNDEVEAPQQYFGLLGYPLITSNDPEVLEKIRKTEGQRLEPSESEELSDLLGRTPVHALTAASGINLLALVELEKYVDDDYASLDDPAVRFLHIVRLREYANYHKKQPSTEIIPFQSVAWALWSDGTDSLFQTIKKVKKDVLSWDDFLNLRISLWLKSNSLFREACDYQANQLYQKSKNPRDAVLFFVALGKMNVLSTLFKVHGESRLSEFFSRDFTEEKNRNIASKNALASFSKGNVLLGCGYFLLAGRYEDAAQAIIQKLDNWPLSYAICRLVDDSPLLGPVSEAFLKKQLQQLNQHPHSDPWTEHIIKYLLRDYTSAGEIAWKINCGRSDHRYEKMVALSNLPQLFVIKSTLFSPSRQARLLLQSVCDSLSKQNYAKALTYFRKFVEAKREADNPSGGGGGQDDAVIASGTMDFGNWGMSSTPQTVTNPQAKKDARKAEKRRIREAKKQQEAIDSGVMDFGGMWGGQPTKQAEVNDDTDSEYSDHDDGDISEQVVETIKNNLSIGVLSTQLAVLSSTICLSPSISTWRTLSERWNESFASITKELDISQIDQQELTHRLQSNCIINSDLVGFVLVYLMNNEVSTLLSVPSEVITWSTGIFNSLSLLGVKSRIPDQANSKSTSHITNQLYSLLHLFSSKENASVLFRALCVNLVVDAWESRNVTKMVALLQSFSERENESLIEATDKIFADKKKLDQKTLDAWEDQKYDDKPKEEQVSLSQNISSSLLSLVAHCLSFRIRSILGGGRSASVTTLQFYASCLGNSNHILNSIPLIGERVSYFGPSPLSEASTLPSSPMLQRALKHVCRHSLRTDLTGYTVSKSNQEVPPQLHDLLWSLNSICRHNEGLKQLLTILQQKNLVKLTNSQKSAMVSGSCSIREIVSLIQSSDPQRSSSKNAKLSENTTECHKSKKGGVYSFLIDDIHTRLAIICETRGVNELSLNAVQEAPTPTRRSSSSHARNLSPSKSPSKSPKQRKDVQSPPPAPFVPSANSDDESLSSLSSSMTRRARAVRAQSFRSEKLLLELSAEIQKGDPVADQPANKMKLVVGHPKLPLHATACTDTVNLHSTGSGSTAPLKTYRAVKDQIITKLAFSLNGSVLASGDNKGFLSCWRIDPSTTTDGSILPSPVSVVKDKEPISCLFFLDEGTIVGIVGGGKGPNYLILHDLMHLRHGTHPGIATVNLPHEMEATCAAVVMPRRDIIVCGRRGEIAIYDVTNIRFPIYHAHIHTSSIRAVSVCPDRDLVAVGTSDGDIKTFYPSKGLSVVQSFSGVHPKSKIAGFSFDSIPGISCLQFTENALYSSGSDGKLLRRELVN